MSPNLSDLSPYLKKDHITNGTIVIIKDAGEIKEHDFSKAKDGSDKRKIFQIKVTLASGKEKIATLNKTSRDILSGFWGYDTDDWVGKKAKIMLVDQLAFGKMMKVMIWQPEEVKPVE